MNRKLGMVLVAGAGLGTGHGRVGRAVAPAAVIRRPRPGLGPDLQRPAAKSRHPLRHPGQRHALRGDAQCDAGGQTALRLRIGSGSLEEDDAEQGLAHFLEHLSFKGSTHVPNGDMIRILERHGLAFGADTNAQTQFTQTVFELDLPQSDPDTRGVGLMLLREIGGELTLPAGPMNTERGVVLSEERLRDTPEYEAFKADWQFQFRVSWSPTACRSARWMSSRPPRRS